jgi:hypothetical protein
MNKVRGIGPGRHAAPDAKLAGSVPGLRTFLVRAEVTPSGISRAMWASLRFKVRFLWPIAATGGLVAGAAMFSGGATDPAAWTLLVAGCGLALLAWVRFVAFPFVTKGKLPEGRTIGDVTGPWRLTFERRKALRERRNSPEYRGPHAHRRPGSLPAPGADDRPRGTA